MNKKKVVALLLIAVLFFVNFGGLFSEPPISFAYDVDQIRAYLLENYSGCTADDEVERLAAMTEMATRMGEQFKSEGKNMQANMGILMTFGKIAYTEAKYNHFDYLGHGEYMKGEDDKYHYEFLGYTRDEVTLVTDPMFPNVSGTTDFFATYQNKNWFAKAGASKTWTTADVDISKFMLFDAAVSAQDGGSLVYGGGLTAFDVIKGAMIDDGVVSKASDITIDHMQDYFLFQTQASTKITGTERMYHVTALGSEYRRTLTTEPVPFPEPVLQVNIDQTKLVYASDELKKTVTGEVVISFEGDEGKNNGFDDLKLNDEMKLGDYVKDAEITINNSGEVLTGIIDSSTSTITAPFSLDISRFNFHAGQEETLTIAASYDFTLQDKFMKDNYIDDGEGSVDVLVEAGDINPYFDIFIGDEIYTDSEYGYKGDFTGLDVRLEPKNTVDGANAIKQVVWRLAGFPTDALQSGNNNVTYTITPAMLDTYTEEGLATFTMRVVPVYPVDYGTEKDLEYIDVVHTLKLTHFEEDEPLPSQQLPPVAKLTIPDIMRQGELIKYSGDRSYDRDGEITEYEFYGKNFEIVKTYTESRGRATILEEGLEDVTERVHDDTDLTDKVTKEVVVEKAVEAKMRIDGLKKENRRFTLNGSGSTGTHYFPISDYIWTIEPLEGQDPDSIKFDTDNTGMLCDVLAKEPGAYQVTLTAKASCTFTGETSRTSQDTVSYPITIQPDLPPVASLTVTKLSLRNPADSLKALIEVISTSYAKDGDEVEVTSLNLVHDSDNDGSISDEVWETTGITDTYAALKVENLGDYYLYVTVKDVIPAEDTIERFLSPSDYLTDDSLDNDMGTQHCLVDNVAPVISTSAELEKEVDLLVVTDEMTNNYTELISQVNRLKKSLYERKIKLNENIIHADEITPLSAGSKKIQTFIWNRVVHIFLRWNWYESYDGSRTMLQNIVRQSGGIVESKQGTLEEMIDFPTYPDAYAEVVGYNVDSYESSSGVHRYRFESAIVDVYNGLNDFFKQIETGYLVGMSYNNSKDYSYYSSDGSRPSVGSTDSWYAINKTPKVDTSESYSSWEIGELVSEEDGDFNTIDLDPILSQYSDSENDKYLIFALANGENFFMTDAMRNQIINEGYKVYFSMDEFWSEFKPTPSEATAVRLDDDGGLYALTKYGNAQYNYSSADDVYYSQRANEDRTQYSLDLESLGFKTIQADTGGIYLPVAYLKNVGVTGYDNDARAWHFPTVNGVFYPYNKVKYMYTYGSADISKVTWTLQTYSSGSVTIGDETFEIVRGYSFKGGTGAIIETTEGEFYYISPSGGGNNNTSNGSTRVETLSYTKLDISGIDAVYNRGFVKGNISTIVQSELRDVTVYDEIETNCGGMREDVFIIKDSAGGYVFLKPKHTAAIYEKRISMSAYPLIFYFNDLSDVRIHTKDITFYDIYSNRSLYKTIGYVDLYYLYSKSKGGPTFEEIRSKMDFFMPHSNYQFLEYYTYTLIDENGDVYIDDKKRISGAQSADYNASVAAYVDAQGNVKGAGYPVNGEIGQNEYSGSFIDVFNTPYTLNEPYAQEEYANILDFVSRTPQAIRTDRGDYATIVDAILEQYESYTTDETVLIVVGDEIDVSGFVHDYESDPVYEKRLDVTPYSGYFDNETGTFVPPADFDTPFVVDKPGKMDIEMHVRDDSVGIMNDFDEYRYWNKDSTTITVIAHRKPIAKLSYELVPVTDGVFTFIGDYTKSYDADHSLSRADKGIVDYRYYYRTEYRGEWTQFDGTLPLERNVVYHFALQVKDVEGSWSDYDTADIEVNGELFILNGSINPSYPTGVPAGETVTLTAELITDKIIDKVTATIEGEPGVVILAKDSSDGNNQSWSASYVLPETRPDRDYYDVTLSAEASDGLTRVYPLKLLVSTPLNLTGDIDPYEIKKGQVGTITAQTSIHASSCTVSLFDDLYGGTASEVRLALSKSSVSGNVQNWEASYVFDEDAGEGVHVAKFEATTPNGNTAEDTDTFMFIPNQPPTISVKPIEPDTIYEGDDVMVIFEVDDEDGDDLELVVEYSTDNGTTWSELYTESGIRPPAEIPTLFENVPGVAHQFSATVTDTNGESASVTGVFDVIPIQLINLRITAITDHAFKNEVTSPIYVGNMAVDESNHTESRLMKMGYAYNFEVDSIGLMNADDTVLIIPKFKTLDGDALDMYYSDERTKYILGVSAGGGTTDANDLFKLYYTGDMKADEYLGSFAAVMLPTALRDVYTDYETWKGRYGVPDSAVFVKDGRDPAVKANRYEEPVIVEFVPMAVKDGSLCFDYVSSGQWESERWNGAFKINVAKYSLYDPGDMILIDASSSSQDDYDADRILR